MLAAIVPALIAATLCVSAAAESPPTTRLELQRGDLSLPGREARQVRIDFPPGAEAPRHSHPGEEVIYVLEGVLEYQLAGQAPVTLRAGEVLFVPRGVSHSARNPTGFAASELATYIVDKGVPLLMLDRQTSQ